MGGKFHLKLNIGSKPIGNKYHEGKVKRTLKRELKVPEIAEREPNRTSASWRDWRVLRGCLAASAQAWQLVLIWPCVLVLALLVNVGSESRTTAEGLVIHSWVGEYSLWGLLSGLKHASKVAAGLSFARSSCALRACSRACRMPFCLCPKTMTKWFYPTRLETRTKESNICASSWVVKPSSAMKVIAGIFAPATD